jgi:hypothetical protein
MGVLSAAGHVQKNNQRKKGIPDSFARPQEQLGMCPCRFACVRSQIGRHLPTYLDEEEQKLQDPRQSGIKSWRYTASTWLLAHW